MEAGVKVATPGREPDRQLWDPDGNEKDSSGNGTGQYR